MVKARWSVALEGDHLLDFRVQRGTGRVLVSTSKGCYALGRSGAIDWKLPNMTIRREEPTGCLIARATLGDSVLITRDGIPVACRPADGIWRILEDVDADEEAASLTGLSELAGADGGRRAGRVPIGSFEYALIGTTFSRYSADGELLSSVALPREPLIAALHRAGRAAMARFEHALPSLKYQDLTHDQRRDRIIAWGWSMPGWVMALELDGAIEWVTLPTIECCNHVRLLPREDAIVHGSSCGRRLTFISGDGATRGVRDFEDFPTSLFVDGEGGVVVGFGQGGLAGHDARGAPQWTFDCPPVQAGIVDEGTMYAVISPERGLLELNAFDLEAFKSA